MKRPALAAAVGRGLIAAAVTAAVVTALLLVFPNGADGYGLALLLLALAATPTVAAVAASLPSLRWQTLAPCATLAILVLFAVPTVDILTDPHPEQRDSTTLQYLTMIGFLGFLLWVLNLTAVALVHFAAVQLRRPRTGSHRNWEHP